MESHVIINSVAAAEIHLVDSDQIVLELIFVDMVNHAEFTLTTNVKTPHVEAAKTILAIIKIFVAVIQLNVNQQRPFKESVPMECTSVEETVHLIIKLLVKL
jgi:hypothetical protein